MASLGFLGCITANNYTDPDGPRYGGLAPAARPAAVPVETLRVATFNIENGREIERALEVIRENAPLRDADVLLLQEMDAAGTERIAALLGMSWVYYPAREGDGGGLGNAILSRWPIESDEKLLLPHRSWFGGTRRIATVATLRVGRVPVRVYSTHLAIPLNQSAWERREQWLTILEDAAPHARVVVGGDLNSATLPMTAGRFGFWWATRRGPRTTRFARVDHILFKGLAPMPDSVASGTVLDHQGASDHRPVWARARLR